MAAEQMRCDASNWLDVEQAMQNIYASYARIAEVIDLMTKQGHYGNVSEVKMEQWESK